MPLDAGTLVREGGEGAWTGWEGGWGLGWMDDCLENGREGGGACFGDGRWGMYWIAGIVL